MAQVSPCQLAVHKLLLCWQHTRRAYWRCWSFNLRHQLQPVTPESESPLPQASPSPSVSSSDSSSESSLSSSSSESSSGASHPLSRHSTSGSSVVSTASSRVIQDLCRQQNAIAHNYASFAHTMRRIHSILRLLLCTCVLAPHKVSKCSQVGLVIELFKGSDPLRFRQNLRVDPHTFDFLVTLIEDDPVFHNNSNVPQLPVSYQLAIVLFRFGHYGNASSAAKVAQWAGCSAGNMVKATRRIMSAFLPLHDRAVCWPTEDEKWEASNWVEDASCEVWHPGFAMVDGTLIPLHAKPGFYGAQFFDRKSQYSLNVQVCFLIIYHDNYIC
jgi:hypothetical protein